MKRKTPTIAQGRLQADIKMTTAEIEYHTMYPHKNKAQQERIISRRVKHLAELKEKMKYE